MRYGIERKLKKSIDQAALVSFDLYDTLIFRRHGTPWEVFRFMGCLLNQPDFLKERVQMQQKAYRFVAHRYQFPHPFHTRRCTKFISMVLTAGMRKSVQWSC